MIVTIVTEIKIKKKNPGRAVCFTGIFFLLWVVVFEVEIPDEWCYDKEKITILVILF